MWYHNETGYAMSLVLGSWAATTGSPTGCFVMGFFAQTKGWSAVFWALMGFVSFGPVEVTALISVTFEQ